VRFAIHILGTEILAFELGWLSSLYVNLTQDHCDGLIRDHLGEEVVAQASS